MQGIWIDGRRPKSKKEVREVVAEDDARVYIEATSLFGNEYEGVVTNMPDGRVSFVGPDPYNSRKFYGTLTKRDGKVTVK